MLNNNYLKCRMNIIIGSFRKSKHNLMLQGTLVRLTLCPNYSSKFSKCTSLIVYIIVSKSIDWHLFATLL